MYLILASKMRLLNPKRAANFDLAREYEHAELLSSAPSISGRSLFSSMRPNCVGLHTATRSQSCWANAAALISNLFALPSLLRYR
jgi:hypothetical protein